MPSSINFCKQNIYIYVHIYFIKSYSSLNLYVDLIFLNVSILLFIIYFVLRYSLFHIKYILFNQICVKKTSLLLQIFYILPIFNQPKKLTDRADVTQVFSNVWPNSANGGTEKETCSYIGKNSLYVFYFYICVCHMLKQRSFCGPLCPSVLI